jgi:hypothetical protein
MFRTRCDSLHQEHGRSHSSLDRPDGTLDRFAPLVHPFPVLVEPSLNGFDNPLTPPTRGNDRDGKYIEPWHPPFPGSCVDDRFSYLARVILSSCSAQAFSSAGT